MTMSDGGDGDASFPMLKLHSWDDAPLPVHSFKAASLSPSRHLLLLHSHHHQALLMPLHHRPRISAPPSPLHPASPSPSRSSSEVADSFHTPFVTPSAPRLSSFSSPSSSFPSTAPSKMGTPYFTPSVIPLSLSPERMSPESPPPTPHAQPKSLPSILNVSFFAWGCPQDDYSIQRALFKELLFVVRTDGLFIHSFLVDEQQESRLQVSAGGGSLQIGIREGWWKNWSSEECDRAETHERQDNTAHFDKMHDAVGFVTYCFDAELKRCTNCVELKFERTSFWPHTARVISYGISYDSIDFSYLSAFCRDYRNKVMTNDSADFCPDSNVTDSQTVEPCEFSAIISNSSHDLLGMFLQKKGHHNMAVKAHLSTKHEFVILCRVFAWGIRWVSVVDVGKLAMESGDSLWAAFAVAGDNLFGLQERGHIFVWTSENGKLLASIDVTKHYGYDSKIEQSRRVKSNQAKKAGDKISRGNRNLDGLNTNISEEEAFTASEDVHLQAVTEKTELQSGKSSRVVNKFRKMLVTADCLLIAVTDFYGIVYLVSTEEYLFKPPHSTLGLGSWGIAGCDIGTQRLCLSHRHGLQVSAMVYPKDADREENRLGCADIWMQDSVNGKLSVSSYSFNGFVKRTILMGSGLKRMRFGRDRHQAVRRVCIPPGHHGVDAVISLNPFAITQMLKLEGSHQTFKLVINILHISGEVCDDSGLDGKSNTCTNHYIRLEREVKGHLIGFCLQGYLYIVSSRALFVVLPPFPHRACHLQGNSQRRWWLARTNLEYFPADYEKSSDLVDKGMAFRDWQLEVLDKSLIYDDLRKSEQLSLENGWSLQLVRLRKLQLALDYTKLDEIEQALEALEQVGVAELGIPRLLFFVVELMLDKFGGDNELGQAARVLAVAARFTTRLVRLFGMEGQRQHHEEQDPCALKDYYPGNISVSAKGKRFSRLHEMARFLEVIRNLQDCLQSRRRRSNPRKKSLSDEATKFFLEGTQNLFLMAYDERDEIAALLENEPDTSNGSEEHSLKQISSSNEFASSKGSETEASWELVQSGSPDEHSSGISYLLESPKDMFFRWEKGRLDISGIVQDALRAGRLPLAVVQLHHLYSKHQLKELPPQNAFKEVQVAGRAFVYELFCKGDTTRAMAALRRLGEDIEAVLRELAFGTVNRFLRAQVLKELQKLNCLEHQDARLLDIVLLLEKVHPSGSFWGTYGSRQRLLLTSSVSEEHLESDSTLQITCHMNPVGKFTIDCGDIDGVVIGSWNFSDTQENVCSGHVGTYEGYWAGAAVWMNVWDRHTLDKVVLDQSLRIEAYHSWEACLEYESLRHNWAEVSVLLDSIPSSVLQDGEIHICLDCDDSVELFDPLTEFSGSRMQHNDSKTCGGLDVDAVEIILPRVKILTVKFTFKFTGWMRQMIEERLARNLVFLRTYYHGTQELVTLIARAGLLFGALGENPDNSKFNDQFGFAKSSDSITVQKDAVQVIHELIVRYCVRQSLPNFLQLYLDHHAVAVDSVSAAIMQAVVGDCQWALWLLLSRIKGREYDASFANARAILAPNATPERVAEGMEIDELLPTVDDVAEAGGELMALSMLMYAPVALQRCICTGSVNRLGGASWQCTLENLRPGLQQYPTLWHTLDAACFGQDARRSSVTKSSANPVVSKAGLNSYLEWREKLFTSASGDASLLLMLPRWLPKSIHRLVELAIQGPVGGGQSYLHNIAEGYLQHDRTRSVELNPLTWEAALQKNIKEELYASSFEEDEMGVEHHLRRGRALAAFNRLIILRAHNANSQGSMIREHVGRFQRGQMNFSSELQALLAPLAANEEKLIMGVLALAIMHYDNPVTVAACASFLELCGLPAHVLRIDAAALCRIGEFHKASGKFDSQKMNTPVDAGSTEWGNSVVADVTMSLARALADEYIKAGLSILRGKAHISSSDRKDSRSRPPKAFLAVLQQLEKASLMEMSNEHPTAGSWLLNGFGDGSKLRAQQREASEYWSLVTNFCHAHQLQISTIYLAALARDRDWVGFLAEAQLEGCPINLLISVATKEFTDPRLQSHILIVLKGLQSAWQKPETAVLSQPLIGALQSENVSSVLSFDLFEVLAECEHENKPGKALLARAKDLRWPLLAVVASCFTDVTSLSCLIVWLEITAARETSLIKVNDVSARIATQVGHAVEASNALPSSSRAVDFRYNRKNAKRQRLDFSEKLDTKLCARSGIQEASSINADSPSTVPKNLAQQAECSSDPDEKLQQLSEGAILLDGSAEQECLSKMVAILCEQQRFSPLLKAFELFAPSSSLLPFIRFLQAFSQMQLSEATAHLTTFSIRLKEEGQQLYINQNKSVKSVTAWIGAAAVGAADAMLASCPSAYERHCLLQLLSTAEFGDGGTAVLRYRCLYWRNQLMEPAFWQGLDLGMKPTDINDEDLLSLLEKHGKWDEARTWAHQLEIRGQFHSVVHHVTETQAEAMVTEWKEFLWDLPEQRTALWNHCHSLFIKHSFPPLQAGTFFLKHADNVENEVPPSELHVILLLAMQWLSGSITQTPIVYSQYLLRELETRVWLLAVESENEMQETKRKLCPLPVHASLASELGQETTSGKGINVSPIDKTANTLAIIENHLKNPLFRPLDESKDAGDSHMRHSTNTAQTVVPRTRRKSRFGQHKKAYDGTAKGPTEISVALNEGRKSDERVPKASQAENFAAEDIAASWEDRIGEQELERAVLSLLDVGQISAAKQLQHKLAPLHAPLELLLVDAAYSIAILSESNVKGSVMYSLLQPVVIECLQSAKIINDITTDTPFQVLEEITKVCREGCGRGLCKRITAVAQIAKFLDLPFAEAYRKHPLDILQLLSLKAQDALSMAELLIKTHVIPAASIARIFAESFLKGLLAAHRGGYMGSSLREEGPAPLMWRHSDFLEWAKLCPSESELGHALMRLVISGHDMPHACEVELLILAHHLYMASACLDGIDVLLAFAATRVESFVSEADFPALARLATGINNFQTLHFILDILIENGQLDLLLQKQVMVDTAMESSAPIQGFQMSILATLKHFIPHDLDAFATVYSYFNMKHELAALLESKGRKVLEQWLLRHDPEQSEELLEIMRYNVEATEIYASIDAGNKARWCSAQASLVSLQLRMSEIMWLNLTETNARRLFVEQSRFQEALAVAEAYGLNQPAEWVPVLWNQMLHPGWIDQFLGEFVAALPLPSNMLMELARFYRAEVTARGDQLDFSKWLTPGGLPLEWARYLGRSFRCLLKYVRDVRLRIQLATLATGFSDVIDVCQRILDKVPDTAGPLILRKGHGGTYLPLM